MSEERQVHSVSLSLHNQAPTCVGVCSELRARSLAGLRVSLLANESSWSCSGTLLWTGLWYLPCRAQDSHCQNYALPPALLHAPQLAGRALLVYGGLGVSQQLFPSHWILVRNWGPLFWVRPISVIWVTFCWRGNQTACFSGSCDTVIFVLVLSSVTVSSPFNTCYFQVTRVSQVTSDLRNKATSLTLTFTCLLSSCSFLPTGY